MFKLIMKAGRGFFSFLMLAVVVGGGVLLGLSQPTFADDDAPTTASFSFAVRPLGSKDLTHTAEVSVCGTGENAIRRCAERLLPDEPGSGAAVLPVSHAGTPTVNSDK